MKTNLAAKSVEPHTIVVRVWHNAKWHDVAMNAVTAPILRRVAHTNPSEYTNPLQSEWDVLSQHRIQ